LMAHLRGVRIKPLDIHHRRVFCRTYFAVVRQF
jgi:hypothetical protein